MSSRPWLFLDVDGVLAQYGTTECPDGWAELDLFPGQEPVRLHPAHGRWLAELAERYDLAWATGWAENANRVLAPQLGLAALPTVPIPHKPFDFSLKCPAIDEMAGDRALAWIDDLIGEDEHGWADRRPAPTLVVAVEPTIGLTRELVDDLLAWPPSRRR